MKHLAAHMGLLVLACCTAFTQDASAPVLQAGDTIYVSTDKLPLNIVLDDSARRQYWDFSNLQAPFVHQVYIRPDVNRSGPNAEHLVYTAADGIGRFLQVKDGTMSITGYEMTLDDRNVTFAESTPPIPFRRSDLEPGKEYSDTYSVEFKIPPEYANLFNGDDAPGADHSLQIRHDLTIDSKVIGQGEMDTPDGKTLYVECERINVRALTVADVMSNGVWHSRPWPDQIVLPDELTSSRRFVFWSSDQAYPVAIVHTDENNKALRVEYTSSPFLGRVVQSLPSAPDIFVHPNPTYGMVRFDMVNLPSGTYTLEIYNILGVLLHSEEIDIEGSSTIPMDLSFLKKGTYIYRLVDSNQNAIRSKRLVIIRP